MQQLMCRRCGASLKVPDDLSAAVASCPFCGEATALPPNLVEARQAQLRTIAAREAQQRSVEHQRTSERRVVRSIGWMLFLFVALPALAVVGIVGAIVWVIHDTTSQLKTIATPPVDPPVVTASARPAPRTIPTDAISTGEGKTAAQLKELYGKGCKNVLMAPKQVQGEKTFKTKFVVGPTCIRFLANTGVSDNKLTLTMQNPFGEKLKTPEPATEIDFTFCPKVTGEHPMTLEPATDDYFTLAAVECPAGLKK